MMNRKQFLRAALYSTAAAALAGCGVRLTAEQTAGAGQGDASVERGDQWDTTANGSGTAPDYAVVFPQDAVNRIDITLTAENWTALHSELEAQFGAQGSGVQTSGDQGFGGGRQLPGGPGFAAQPPQAPEDMPALQPGQGMRPGNLPGGPGMGNLNFASTTYVPSTVRFNGNTWSNVGFRYSGNSTLQNSWRSGTEKISFRLDFDEFEADDPSIKNQRFYGFKQLSFKSNAMDNSYLREKVAADIFRSAGVIAPQTAFSAVYIDYGEGPRYFGVYTTVEIVDDTLIKTQFADDSGNVYKPEGSGAAFIAGTFNEESFEKQTNQKEGDWSDIQALFAALHAPTRTSDPAAWRAGLEAVFDVDAFLRWLAVDTILQNWDTYGAMAHNYYLYADPSDGLLTWIPWDNNMSLSAGGLGAVDGNRAGPDQNQVRSLDLANVSEQWPLIRYLVDDPTYLSKYQRFLAETIGGVFQPPALETVYRQRHELIAPYVAQEEPGFTQLSSVEAFDQALDALIEHARARYDAVKTYLYEQGEKTG